MVWRSWEEEGPGFLLLVLASLAGAGALLVGKAHMSSMILFEGVIGLSLGLLSSVPSPYPWSGSVLARSLGGCAVTVSLTILAYFAGVLLRPVTYVIVLMAVVIMVLPLLSPLLRVCRHG